jgi:phosphoglycerol transferase MdoB-like AlkP superfamily enzyme
VRFSLIFLAGFLAIGLIVRIAFHLAFAESAVRLDPGLIARAYLLGLRYDLRLGLLILLPVLLLGLSRRTTAFVADRTRGKLWAGYFAVIASLWVLFQIFDFAHYAYLGTKLAASIVNFLEDPRESAAMVWQTYPVVRLVALWATVSSGLAWLAVKALEVVRRPASLSLSKRQKAVWIIAGTALVILGIHGRFSQYPLRWSDAYFNPNPFVAALALNPVLNFYDTRKYVGGTYSTARVREAYPRMAAYLGVDHPDPQALDYSRIARPKADAIPGRPNVVIVLMESFSAYKSSLTGNKLDTTPFLKELATQSVVFDRFYTPHTGTARGVFATLTGLPDVDLRNTSSRNPAAVDQHSLANALTGYEAHYFIGGSTTWANVRGVIQKNISNLTIHEEGSFSSPVVDVWGISDKSLFLEANAVFRQATRPFFAIIQTAGNHRPYTIPKEDADFAIKSVPDAELRQNGFFSVEEFNAFRYMDYSVKNFIETARKEKYFDDTIFVFLGDHGIAAQGHDVGPHMPRAYLDLKLSAIHTPLIIHSPKHVKPRRLATVGSQIDVMPTILGLTGVPYRMQALGRDLLDPRFDDRRYAFTIYHDGVGEIGLMDADWYYIKKARSSVGTLHALASENPGTDMSGEEKAVAERFNRMLDDYYQTALYLLTNNRQRPHPASVATTARE